MTEDYFVKQFKTETIHRPGQSYIQIEFYLLVYLLEKYVCNILNGTWKEVATPPDILKQSYLIFKYQRISNIENTQCTWKVSAHDIVKPPLFHHFDHLTINNQHVQTTKFSVYVPAIFPSLKIFRSVQRLCQLI